LGGAGRRHPASILNAVRGEEATERETKNHLLALVMCFAPGRILSPAARQDLAVFLPRSIRWQGRETHTHAALVIHGDGRASRREGIIKITRNHIKGQGRH
jgi:hypothetical protein